MSLTFKNSNSLRFEDETKMSLTFKNSNSLRFEDEAVVIKNVSKKFRIPHEKRMTFRDNILGLIQGKRGYDEFWALRNVSFSVKKGECVGIVGENGSGKSTLLKIIAEVLYPDEGDVFINGRIAPFLELGIGFQGDLTARDNVYLYGSILGINKKDMNKKYDAILEFAELKKFENMKVKNFSSGMYARLAFATAVAIKPDILLLDEVLAVGDEKFQMKCREKINEFKKEGATIVLVSHSMETIQNICDRAMLLEHGSLKTSGNVWDTTEKYREDMGVKRLNMPSLIMPSENDFLGEEKDINLSWDINNSIDTVGDIELRIRDITERDDGKLEVLRLSNNISNLTIKVIPDDKERKYRWTIKARSSTPSKYQDSEYGPARIFSIKGNINIKRRKSG